MTTVSSANAANGNNTAAAKGKGRAEDPPAQTNGNHAAATGAPPPPVLANGTDEPAAPKKRTQAPIERATYGGVTWVIDKKLGEGSFGEIYHAVNEGNPRDDVAVKFGRGEGREMLQREAKILFQLRGYSGVPEIRACWTEGEYCVMVMQLLGESLSDLMIEYDLSVKVVLYLADQMIQHLEYIHSKNILHGDLKPSNFLLGIRERRNSVVLIDFGLCEEYRNPETKKHIPFSDKHGFHGTPRYCSLHVHNGIASSRRDDMESLGYVLVYLLLGKLPWQNLPAEENETKKQKRRKIAEMKQSLPVEELCAGLPEEFATYINITRNLKFKQKPNYYQLRALFRNLLTRLCELDPSSGFPDSQDWISQLERKKKQVRRAPSKPTLPVAAGGPGAADPNRRPTLPTAGSNLGAGNAAANSRYSTVLPQPGAGTTRPRAGTLTRILDVFRGSPEDRERKSKEKEEKKQQEKERKDKEKREKAAKKS
jgi:serine/threonine protein kinase